MLNVVGDVRGCACLIIDDMITTGGTIASAVAALLKAGAEITVAATHGVLVEGAREQLGHPSIRRIVVTDTIAQRHSGWDKLTVVSVASMLAAAIQRLSGHESMRDSFEGELFCNGRRYAPKITD